MTVPVDAIFKKFSEIDCASICDASPLARAMDCGIKPVSDDIKFVGRAKPVSCVNDYLTVIKAMEDARPGDVLVVNGHRQAYAVFGELLAMEAKRRGLAGAVVDGAVRDINGMKKVGFPVFYRFVNPQAGRAEVIEPPQDFVSVGGVIVETGDWILADSDGVVVVPDGQIEVVLEVASEIQKAESRVAHGIAKGQILSDLLKLEEFRREHEKDIRSRLETYLAREED